mgnify:FL=1
MSRTLKDTIKDPRVKRRPARERKKTYTAVKIGLALVLGFAGGFSLARVVRFL